MKLLPAYVLVVTVTTTSAQSITPGSAQALDEEGIALFAAPHFATVNSVTFTAGSAATCSSALPEEIQFGVARGFRGVNGFVLSTGWVENGDQENPPASMSGDPTACAFGTGLIGLTAPACAGVAPTITSLLTASPATNNAASYVVDFDVPLNTRYQLSYEFVTYENPASANFFDAFAVVLDGDLLAGGTSSSGPGGGPEPGTDPWVLTPSQALPSEFNSQPITGTFFTPAHSTGMRTVEVVLSAGNHVLEFHVADSGAAVATPSCDEAVDELVDSMLLVGLNVFESGSSRALASGGSGAHTGGVEIGREGHPVQSGGAFPNDLKITVDGVPPGSFLFLLQSPTDSPGFSLNLLAPLEFVIGLAPFQLLASQIAGPTGSEFWPPTPINIAPTVSGDFFYQWWGLATTGFYNSNGLKLVY